MVTTRDRGINTNSVARVTSTKKLPSEVLPSLTMPRKSANMTARPTAGVTKF